MEAITRRALAALLALALAAAGTTAGAQPPAQAPAAQAGTTGTQALARELLTHMALFLAQAPRFSVTLVSGYDAVQADGRKIEFGDRRKVTLSRPAQLRVDTERGDGGHVFGFFTGQQIVLVDVPNRVYATTPQPDGVDESIVHLISDLGVRLPLAMLLSTRLPAELDRRVRSVDYVEKTNLLGTPAHHLSVRGDTVDFQVWIADGAQPVPLRVVIDYRDEPGQPQFRALLADWNFAPTITDATFTPSYPQGARKIAFATQLAAAARAEGRTPTAKGGQQ
jgi:hypothetical protein